MNNLGIKKENLIKKKGLVDFTKKFKIFMTRRYNDIADEKDLAFIKYKKEVLEN